MPRAARDAALPRPRSDRRLRADTPRQPVRGRHAHAAPQGPPRLQDPLRRVRNVPPRHKVLVVSLLEEPDTLT
eukprot:6115481-Lingulodinium_polyedra.AAC.1